MRNRLFFALAMAIVFTAISASAQKTAYGYTMLPAENQALISFSTDNPSNAVVLGSYSKAEPRSGAAVKGKLYMMGIDDDFCTWFYTMNLATGESETIKKLGEITIPADMSYDYMTETMYSIANSETVDGVSALSTVDLETGQLTCIIEDLGHSFKAIALNASGQLFALSKEGVLYQINKITGETQQVGPTGLRLATWFGFQSMEFDRETGELYLAAWTSENKSQLYTIDTATGAATLAGDIASGAHTIALTIPYEPSSGLAPDRVTDLTLEPAPNGELMATLRWVNPVNDYEGHPLNGTVSINIVHTASGQAKTFAGFEPGQAMETRFEVEEAGMHNFAVTAYNEAGTSLVRNVEGWIGPDVPTNVGQVKAQLSRTQSMVNILSWSAPTEGLHGGYLDQQSLTYDVVRENDGKVIAQDLTSTTCDDQELLADLTRYSYRIIAKSAAGYSEGTLTNDLVNGPAQECPYVAPFNSWEESGQYWTILDANEDKYPFVWYSDFMNMFGQGGDKGFYIYQKNDVFYAYDFIISPPIKFTEGHEYRITATVSNDDIYGYREERFRFYTFTGYDMAGALPLGNESFIVKHPGEFRDYSLTFTVDDDGFGTGYDTFPSFIALCCNSQYDMGMFLVSAIAIEDITPAPQPLTGDVNGDGVVNISDINVLIDMILSGKSRPNGDLNGDGSINIADINEVIDIILGH